MSLRLKKFNFSTLSLFSLLPVAFLIDHVSYAKSSELAYVYCVKEDKKWEWLKDKHGNYVKVLGQKGVTPRIRYFSGPVKYTSKYIHIKYFQIEEDASNKIKKFQRQCMDLYGNDYKYAQPAYSRFTGWMPFVTDNGELAPGFYEVEMLIKLYRRTQDPLYWTPVDIELNSESNKTVDQILDEKIVQTTDTEVSLRRVFNIGCAIDRPYARKCIEP